METTNLSKSLNATQHESRGSLSIISGITNQPSWQSTQHHFFNDVNSALTVKPKKTKLAKSSSKAVVSLFVLLVEDDPIVQKIHCIMLEKLGHRVDVVASGKEALKLFSQNSYDVILTDIGLPGMSGIEITAEIRRLEKSITPIPIIAVTAYVQEDIQNDCLKAGANAVATKPLQLDALKQLLEQHTTITNQVKKLTK